MSIIQAILPGLAPMLYGKRCRACSEIKPLSEYPKKAESKNGLSSRCKVCRAKYNHAYCEEHKAELAAKACVYRETHKEELAAKRRAYREANLEKFAAKDRAYREANPEKIAVRQAAYYAEHREELDAYRRIRGQSPEAKAHKAAYQVAYCARAENKAKMASYQAAYYQTNRQEILARQATYGQTPQGRAVKSAATHRRRLYPGGQSLSAAITREVMEASSGICPYCGDPFEDGHIDHIIPVSKGGTNDRANLVYCCAGCNLSKGAKTLEEWESYELNACG